MKHQWIEERLADLSKNKSELASALSLPPSRVTEIIAGKRQVKLNELRPMARFLRLPLTHLFWLLEGNTSSNRGIHPRQQPVALWVVGEQKSPDAPLSVWPHQHHYLLSLPLPKLIQLDQCFLVEAPKQTRNGARKLLLYQSHSPLCPNWRRHTQQLTHQKSALLVTISLEHECLISGSG
ncbi:helix-turn-helix domain-containing protein [Sneathiella limimaris]|uniref:helix-turn-helix domain-containing protein n=1 Tax=Sneathiella limimaris TaxID=1964213 RepID=UPI00146D28BF|nr:helix-turn-helix transcriptional regulator [Sneathiella limimaris]